MPDWPSHLFGLSRLYLYEAALSDEPARLAHKPLAEILETSPPRAFAELWRSDLRRWFKGLANPTDFQAAEFVRGVSLFDPPGDRHNTEEDSSNGSDGVSTSCE